MGKALPHDADLRSFFFRAPRSKEPRVELTSTTLAHALNGAEQLLIYAAEAGIAVDPDVAARIITATRQERVWDDPQADKLIGAIAALAARVHPVTAQSLALCRRDARNQIRRYTRLAILLVLAILPLSFLLFITSGLSTTMSGEIESANAAAVALHTQLFVRTTGSPPAARAANVDAPVASTSELQQFAATLRSLNNHAGLLKSFELFWRRGVFTCARDCELNPALHTLRDVQGEGVRLTRAYQTVRSEARAFQDMNTYFYGAVTTVLLPILYALLGVCAYLLRLFQRELNNGTFSNQYDISARFFVGLIGGLVVGLFTNFNTSGASLSPLALAFLVGYAADVFFSFLESFVAGFRKAPERVL